MLSPQKDDNGGSKSQREEEPSEIEQTPKSQNSAQSLESVENGLKEAEGGGALGSKSLLEDKNGKL